MNDPRATRVICPFFQRFDKIGSPVIVCEGISAGTETATLFKDKHQMGRWTSRLCNTFEYGRCPVAECVAGRLERLDELRSREK